MEHFILIYQLDKRLITETVYNVCHMDWLFKKKRLDRGSFILVTL